MKTILDKIVKTKQLEIEHIKHRKNEFLKRSKNLQSLSFLDAIDTAQLSVIAEVKKASPSKGIINHNFDYLSIAASYVSSGARALSVLTDEHYFQGHNDYLTQIKQQVSVPVLRKDFIIDDIQIYEAYYIGADAILLILAILSVQQAQEFIDCARSLNLDILVEIHSQSDIDKLLQLKGVRIIGINNRDLTTFNVNLNTSLQLKKKLESIFSDVCFVAESGYQEASECIELQKNMFNAVLIGEGLVTNQSLKEFFR